MKFDECNQLLPELVDDLDCAKMGRLNSYLQGMMQRECTGVELSREEQAQVRRIQVALQNVPQWSDEEAVQVEMAEQGGQVLFCKFFKEHLYSIAFVLDYEISRKERKAASRLVQRLLKESSKSWDIDLLTFPVPEMMKYASLCEYTKQRLLTFWNIQYQAFKKLERVICLSF